MTNAQRRIPAGRRRHAAVRFAALALVAAAAVLLYANQARAAVSLVLSDNDATPQAATVARGGSINVSVLLTSTSEKVTGLDYYLQAAGAAAGKLRITARSLTGTSFSDVFRADTGDNAANAGVLDSSVSLLNPRNGVDLGASIANVANALSAGTYTVATYTLSIDPATSPGTYTLSTLSPTGAGWTGAAPTFADGTFSSQGSFALTVTTGVGGVVPEPSSAVLLLGAMIPVFLRRRR